MRRRRIEVPIRKIEMTILSAPPPAVRPRLAAPRYASWQDAMKDAVRDPDELCRLLDLPDGVGRRRPQAAARQFPLFVPRGFVARMRPGDPADPLLRQVLPLAEELADVPGFVADPVGDADGHAAAGTAAQIRRPRAADHDRHVRRPLPLLLPPPFSVRRGAALARRLAAGARRDRGRRDAPRSDSQRRRSADDRRSRRWPSWSTSWRRFRICGDCGFTRGCRS